MVQPRLSARARAAVVADVLLFAAAVPLILVDPRLGWYVFLGAMLLPVVALFAVLVARIVGRTRWYRNGLAVLLVFTGISAIVCVGSLLVWYPFLPLLWSLDEVPLAFSIPMLAGFYGFAFGILALVGLGMARRLSMTGEVVDAARAEKIGLVTEVVAHDRLLDRALELAGQIAEVPGPTMLGLKDIYTTGAASVIDPALAAEEKIAFAQHRDFDGLGDRFRAVSERNKRQIGSTE